MLRVGITGGIGTGKSTVCRVFETLGIPVFYADDVSRDIVNEDENVAGKIRVAFGNDVYNGNILNRKKVADLVFNNLQKLQLLNDIIHPAVFEKFEAWSAKQHAPYVIKEAALIYEAGGDKMLDRMIVVAAPAGLRIRRIMERDGVKEEAVRSRMKNQWPDEEKIKRASFVIYNDEVQPLIPQVVVIHDQLLKLAGK